MALARKKDWGGSRRSLPDRAGSRDPASRPLVVARAPVQNTKATRMREGQSHGERRRITVETIESALAELRTARPGRPADRRGAPGRREAAGRGAGAAGAAGSAPGRPAAAASRGPGRDL